MLHLISELIQLESGPRYVMRGTYKDAAISVICGYLPAEDQWAYHVLVEQTRQRLSRLGERPSHWRADSQQHAYNLGFAAGIAALETRSGFQTTVK